jgi:peptide/nickel transport system substrate-binding protein
MDSRTVRLHLNYPDISLPYALRNNGFQVLPVDFDAKKPIGSGPFKFKSMAPGQLTTLVRNDNYWQSGKPYLDELQVVHFDEPGATRLNALTSGQIDAASNIPFSFEPRLKSASNIKTIISPAQVYHTFEMAMDKPPFDDARVRQAIRLIADRPQIVAQAFSGTKFAEVGNDMASPSDPLYNDAIPSALRTSNRPSRYSSKPDARTWPSSWLSRTLHRASSRRLRYWRSKRRPPA